MNPAVSVVHPTKIMGMIVTHAYFARPLFIINEVPTARAMVARSWFAVPSMGQMVVMVPVYMKYPHAQTTSKLVTIFPGTQFVRSKGFHIFHKAS